MVYICLSTLGKRVHVLGLCVGCPHPTPSPRQPETFCQSHNAIQLMYKKDAKDMSTTFEYDNKLEICSEVEECFKR